MTSVRVKKILVRSAEVILLFISIFIIVFGVKMYVLPKTEVENDQPLLPENYSPEFFREYFKSIPAAELNTDVWKTKTLSPNWRYIVIHHSATSGGTFNAIDKNHREERKWENGFAYHFLIGNGHGLADGEVVFSPRWEKQLEGAHASGFNKTGIGICLIGNFQVTVPTEKQIASLKTLVLYLMKQTGIQYNYVAGHSGLENAKTDCPGAYFPVEEFMRSL